MASRQLTTPVLVDSGQARKLYPIPYNERFENEKWLQELLFKNESLLPVDDLEEPVFSGIIPVGREVETGCGPVDLLYINKDGFITLAETKLWRNPEARRKVVAQIIDYAQSMACWNYEDLVRAVCRTNKESGDPILRAVKEREGELDEREFIDSVEQNLRKGRLLLLIVGDGIREGVEGMVEYLQKAPHLHFTLRLIELGLFRLDPDKKEPLLVQPRILARTKEIVRAVFEVKNQVPGAAVNVTVPEAAAGDRGQSSMISDAVFEERLAELKDPLVLQFIREVNAHAPEHRITLKAGRMSLQMKYNLESGQLSLGHFDTDGKFVLKDLDQQCLKRGLPNEIWQNYYQGIASLVPGARVQDGQVLYGRDECADHIPISFIATKKDRLFQLIDSLVKAVDEAVIQ